MAFPPHVPHIRHVVLNSSAGHQLSLRTGVSSDVIPNVLDFSAPPEPQDDYAADVREAFDIAPDEAVVLQPTRVVARKGIEHAVEHASRFGFDREELPRNLSLALGSGAVTPLDMARGYAVLANGGYLVEPYLVAHVTNDQGDEVYAARPPTVCPECEAAPVAGEGAPEDGEATIAAAPAPVLATDLDAPPPPAPRVISPENRYLMYSMMQDVIRAGTATRARSLGRNDLAGKTGTTNDQRDAWFNGYNQSLVAVVWVGFDSNTKLGRGEVGGRAALPAWIEYMETALEDVPDLTPEMPESMVTVLIDPESGRAASAGQPGAIEEIFRADEIPQMSAATAAASPIGGGSPASVGAAPPVEELF